MLLVFSSVQGACAAKACGGQLVYSAGHVVVLLDLRTRSETVILRAADQVSFFDYPVVRSNSSVILESMHLLRTPKLQLFDVRSKQVSSLVDGTMPTYIKASDTLFLWRGLPGGEHLYIAHLDTLNSALEIGEDPPLEKVNGVLDVRTRPVVAVSRGTVAFLGRDLKVWTYTISTHQAQDTQMDDCLPEAWRTRTSQLVCRRGENGRFLQDTGFSLVDLRTRRSTPINIPKDAHGLVYSPDCDLLFYASEGKGLWSTIRAYDFDHDSDVAVSPTNRFFNHGAWLQLDGGSNGDDAP